MKTLHIIIAALLVFGLQPVKSYAASLDLSDAKTQGFVGEKSDGLLGAITNSPEVTALVESINNGRIESYKQIAEKRGIPLSEVQKLAGLNLIDKTPPGQFVMPTGKGWTRK